MFEIIGEEFISDKEASKRYGYSQSWFLRARAEGYGPRWVRITDRGRVLYPLKETDKWFRDKMEMERE